jgi:hypothetical protein
MRSEVVLGDMAADQVDETIQLLWIGCSNCRKEVIEELLLGF